MHCWLIVGLPGSGKSYLASRMAEDLEAYLVDDPETTAELMSCVRIAVERQQDLIIVDPWLVELPHRNAAREILSEDFQLHWLFFAPDLEACQANLDRRGDQQPINLKAWLARYSLPTQYMMPVWRPDGL